MSRHLAVGTEVSVGGRPWKRIGLPRQCRLAGYHRSKSCKKAIVGALSALAGLVDRLRLYLHSYVIRDDEEHINSYTL